MLMLKLTFYPYILDFIEPGGTSRGVMLKRKIWILFLENENGETGIGECAPLAGLSCENIEEIDSLLQNISSDPARYISDLSYLDEFPSVKFALEMAYIDLINKGKSEWFPSEFTKAQDHIKINGLIWMGTKEKMLERVGEKLSQGFTCLKFKIGAINFSDEYELIRSVREKYDKSILEIRVDANGAFSYEEARRVLDKLNKIDIHSIEQPLKAGKIEETSRLCADTPVPIVLDEELIGIHNTEKRKQLLGFIKPQYIILKPSLTGGFSSSDTWISLAEENSVKWWITSALESNIGLNAIAQWAYTKHNDLPQGLGTGKVFSNNFPSAVFTKGERLFIDKDYNNDYQTLKSRLKLQKRDS